MKLFTKIFFLILDSSRLYGFLNSLGNKMKMEIAYYDKRAENGFSHSVWQLISVALRLSFKSIIFEITNLKDFSKYWLSYREMNIWNRFELIVIYDTSAGSRCAHECVVCRPSEARVARARVETPTTARVSYTIFRQAVREVQIYKFDRLSRRRERIPTASEV